jgi:hypothetical protein
MQDRRSSQSPSKRGGRTLLAKQRRARADRSRAATPPAQRCGERSNRTRHLRAPGRRSRAPEQEALPHLLTLPAMRPTRRPARRYSAPLSFSLVSVLALLALVWIPMAQASGLPEYEEAPEKINVPKHHTNSTKDPVAHAQNAGNGGEVAPESETGGTGPGEGKSGEGESSAGGNPGTGGSGGSGNGGVGNGSPAQGTPAQTQAGAGTGATQSDSGDSSPLVPILIAVAVLAAISVGAVVIRQRRQSRTGGTVSPKAS